MWGWEWGWEGVMECGVLGQPMCVVEGYTVSACGELGNWGSLMGCGSYGVVGHPLCVVEGYTVSACGELWGWGRLWGWEWGWEGVMGQEVGIFGSYGVWDCGASAVRGGGVHRVGLR